MRIIRYLQGYLGYCFWKKISALKSPYTWYTLVIIPGILVYWLYSLINMWVPEIIATMPSTIIFFCLMLLCCLLQIVGNTDSGADVLCDFVAATNIQSILPVDAGRALQRSWPDNPVWLLIFHPAPGVRIRRTTQSLVWWDIKKKKGFLPKGIQGWDSGILLALGIEPSSHACEARVLTAIRCERVLDNNCV